MSHQDGNKLKGCEGNFLKFPFVLVKYTHRKKLAFSCVHGTYFLKKDFNLEGLRNESPFTLRPVFPKESSYIHLDISYCFTLSRESITKLNWEVANRASGGTFHLMGIRGLTAWPLVTVSPRLLTHQKHLSYRNRQPLGSRKTTPTHNSVTGMHTELHSITGISPELTPSTA